jgi:glycerophosphoryl diester phosphodiesterase
VSDRLFLVIERDNFEGVNAQFKKIFLVDLELPDSEGFLVKYEVADLLQIQDPHNISGASTAVFAFPFQTIESVIPLSSVLLGVLNDNNYPFRPAALPASPTTTNSSSSGSPSRFQPASSNPPRNGHAARRVRLHGNADIYSADAAVL